MAGRTDRVAQPQAQMAHIVDQAEARINVLRDRAKVTKQKWDEERQGVVSDHIPKKLITKWKKALEKGEDYTPQLPSEVAPGQDWTFTFEITEKDGKLKIDGLNGIALAQKSYSDLALISGRLTHVANQVRAICQAAKVKHESAGTNGNADAALIKYYRANGWHDLADSLESKLKAETGEDDESHGVTTARITTPIAQQIDVRPPGTNDYDPAQDDGPSDT